MSDVPGDTGLLRDGRVADIFGRRRWFLVGTASFGLTSLVGGMSVCSAGRAVSRTHGRRDRRRASPT